jgi:hypothetical protein
MSDETVLFESLSSLVKKHVSEDRVTLYRRFVGEKGAPSEVSITLYNDGRVEVEVSEAGIPRTVVKSRLGRREGYVLRRMMLRMKRPEEFSKLAEKARALAMDAEWKTVEAVNRAVDSILRLATVRNMLNTLQDPAEKRELREYLKNCASKYLEERGGRW